MEKKDDIRQANGDSHESQLRPGLPQLPSSNPGWLSHVPTIRHDHFPSSPAPFMYSTSTTSQSPPLPASLSSSPAYNLYLLNNHPAYAPPPPLVKRQQQHPDPKTPYLPSNSTLTGGSTAQELDNHGAGLGRSEQLPRIQYAGTVHNDSRNGLNNTTEHSSLYRSGFGLSDNDDDNSPWQTPSFPRLPLSPQVVQSIETPSATLPAIDPALYHIDSFNSGVEQHPLFLQLPNDHQISIIDPPDVLVDGDDDELDDENTDEEETPGASWPGRNRKRPPDEGPPQKQRKKRPRTTQERKRGRRKGELRGMKRAIDPGQDFMKIYNEAVDAFLEHNDIPGANRLVLQAIEHNPEIFAAHSLLADIHFARGDADAGIDALMVGLHAHLNDVDLWRQVADTILQHNAEGYQKRIERAMYCYGAILRKNTKDHDARFQRAECARLLGSWNRAFGDMNILIQEDPHNSAVLAQFARACSDLGDIKKALAVYDDHFEYFRTHGISDEDCFTWQDVGVYVDLMVQSGETMQAIVVLKRLARWLSGREHETYWEEFLEDDRELDQMHYPRRLEVPQFEPNVYPEHNYGEAVPLDLRGKLGILRLKLNFREEAQSHFDWLEPDLEGDESLVEDYSDTFYEVAKALHNAKEHEQALHFYDALYIEGVDLGLEFFMDMAASCYVCDQKERAIQFYEKILELNSGSIDARIQLTKLYTDLRDRQTALNYGNKAVMMAQEKIPESNSTRKYERKEDRLQREAAERALKNAYKIPKGKSKRPGKVPKGLQYRTRYKRKFERWQPQFDTPPPEALRRAKPPTPESPVDIDDEEEPSLDATPPTTTTNSISLADEPPMYDRPIKVPKKPGRPAKPKVPKRKPPNQENAAKHYEEMQQLYTTLLSHQEAMREGDGYSTNVWMDCAVTMVEDFRSVKLFFPGERHKKFEGYNTHTPRPRPPTPTPGSMRGSAAPDSRADGEEVGASTPRTRTPLPADSLPQTPSHHLAPTDVPDEYCGIPFSTWLDLFLELSLLHANSSSPDGQTECYSLINACLDCTLFYHDEQCMSQIHYCFLACCLALGDDLTLYNIVLRWFMREWAFCTDSYRLYMAVGLLNELPPKSNQINDAIFKSAPNQKFIFRQVMSIDKLLPENYNVDGAEGSVPYFMRKPREELRKLTRKADKNGIIRLDEQDNVEPSTPTGADGTSMRHDSVANAESAKVYSPNEMDVVLFILYAQIMMASGSFPNALSYLYRAYSLDPTNTVCLLSMALCYLQELFKRQTENRHSYALMGWAWFGKYSAARLEWAEAIDKRNEEDRVEEERDPVNTDEPETGTKRGQKQRTKMVGVVKREIAFNKARCWEMLGMADLGAKGYKKVLDLAPQKASGESGEEDDDDNDDHEEEWTMEAAYAMSTLYALNGNGAKAREIAEKYLVVE